MIARGCTRLREDTYAKLPIRKYLPIAAGLLILGGFIAFQQYQLSTLSRAVNGAAEKISIDALQTRVNAIDDRIDTVSGKPLVTMEDMKPMGSARWGDAFFSTLQPSILTMYVQ